MGFSHISVSVLPSLGECHPFSQRSCWRLKLLLGGRQTNLLKTGNTYLEFIALYFVIVSFKGSRSLDQFTFLQDLC